MPFIDRRTKLKARRALRKQRKQAESAVAQADENVEKLFLRRFSRLLAVRRFVAVWSVLVLLLGVGALWQVRGMNHFYLHSAPVSGGIYREGIIGTFTNANPLFATSPVDSSVSHLLFSGLFKVSPSGRLQGDLATGIKADEVGKVYTVGLREDVYWHDGEQFDADDVVFTYTALQNPNVRSPIRMNWADVKVVKKDAHTVVFTLPSALSSFQYSLTNGIVPEHILSKVDIADLRSSNFNTTEPVGTGPMKLRRLEVVGTDLETRQERVALTRNDRYHGGNIGLDGVVIRAYRSEDAMLKDFEEQVIQSMVGLTSVSDTLLEKETVSLISAPLTSSVMVFLNNSSAPLAEKPVRQALVRGTDTEAIRSGLGFETVKADSPFLKSQFAYNQELTQLGYDIEQAKKLLDEAGWVTQDNGVRAKDGKPLRLRLVSQSLSEYANITQRLQAEWRALGIEVDAILQPEEDIQTGAIARHDYDVLLYGIAIGHDPDVFAYWHSSQADPNAASRLNLSEFKNSTADEALEAGRTRVDKDLRKVKYEPFLRVWRDEAPALALYQPRFLMVVSGTFEGFEQGQLSKATDRYYSIKDWKIRNADLVK